MYILNGKILELDCPFEHNNTLYPPSWLRLSSAQDRADIGIQEVVEQIRPNDKFYFVQNNTDGSYTALAKDIEQIRAYLILQIKTHAKQLLEPSDWRVTKAIETGEPMPDNWKQYRNQVRQCLKEALDSIAQLNNALDAEKWVCNAWPNPPQSC